MPRKLLVLLARYYRIIKTKKHMMIKRNNYESPAIEVIEIEVEAGFALSGVVGGEDYGDGGEGSEME